VDVRIDIGREECRYLEGHKLGNGQTLFPATGYLVLAWTKLAESLGLDFRSLPVTLQMSVLREPPCWSRRSPLSSHSPCKRPRGSLRSARLTPLAVRGTLRVNSSPLLTTQMTMSLERPESNKDPTTTTTTLSNEDVYKEFCLRGYDFSGSFRSVERMDIGGRWADVKWEGNG